MFVVCNTLIFSDETPSSHKKSTSIVVPVSATSSPITVLPENKQNGDAVMNRTDSDDVLIIVNNKEKSRIPQVCDVSCLNYDSPSIIVFFTSWHEFFS